MHTLLRSSSLFRLHTNHTTHDTHTTCTDVHSLHRTHAALMPYARMRAVCLYVVTSIFKQNTENNSGYIYDLHNHFLFMSLVGTLHICRPALMKVVTNITNLCRTHRNLTVLDPKYTQRKQFHNQDDARWNYTPRF